MSNEGKDNLGYIGENKKSNEDDIQTPTSNYDGGINENEPNTNPIVDVMSADFITKPFSILQIPAVGYGKTSRRGSVIWQLFTVFLLCNLTDS